MSSCKIGKSIIKVTAEVTCGAVRYVGKHQDAIASASRSVVSASGAVVEGVESAAAVGGLMVAEHLPERAGRPGDPLIKGVVCTAAVLAKAPELTGPGVRVSDRDNVDASL